MSMPVASKSSVASMEVLRLGRSPDDEVPFFTFLFASFGGHKCRRGLDISGDIAFSKVMVMMMARKSVAEASMAEASVTSVTTVTVRPVRVCRASHDAVSIFGILAVSQGYCKDGVHLKKNLNCRQEQEL
jgi:hypothetical protein